MRKILFHFFLLLPLLSFAQGQISRPLKQQQNTQHNNTRAKTHYYAPKEIENSPDGYINGHGYVDLGLPSGIKWANCNVGATNTEDYGNYYAWGEIMPKTSYDWSNCFDCLDSSGDSWGVYKFGGKTSISPTSGHDTARENFGGTWRMPTALEWKELNTKCTWKWTVREGHNGYIVTGSNGKSIFLPAAGYRSGTRLDNEGKYGYYWSSSLSTPSSNCSLSQYLYSGHHGECDYDGRRYGLSVRPVTE